MEKKPKKLASVAAAGIILGLAGSILLEGSAAFKDIYPLGWLFWISSIVTFCILIAILTKSENQVFEKLEKIDKLEEQVSKLTDQVSKLTDLVGKLEWRVKKLESNTKSE